MAPSKETTCREWIWEYVFTHCPNMALLRSLAQAYPVPDTSLRLKRMLLLKTLSFEVAEDLFSERVVEIVSCIRNLNKLEGFADGFRCAFHSQQTLMPLKESLTLEDLLLVVKVERTIQYLREDADDWPNFYEALMKHWEEHKEETAVGNPHRSLQLRKELWDVQKSPQLRHSLLERFKKPFARRLVECYLDCAWRELGPTFLDGVAENLMNGLYVPDRSPERPTNAETAKDAKSPLVVTERSKKNMRGALKAKTQEKLKTKKSKKLESPDVAKLKTAVKDLDMVDKGIASHGKGKEERLALKDSERINAHRAETNLSTGAEVEVTTANVPNEACKFGHGSSRIVDVEDELPSEQHASDTQMRDISQDQVPISLSPPPWAGSPGLNSVGSKRRKLDMFHFDDSDARGFPHVERCAQEDQALLDTPGIQKAQSELKEGQANLNAAVKDPLPEALKVAEEIGHEASNLGPVNGRNQVVPSPVQNISSRSRVLPPCIGGRMNADVNQDNQRLRSLMDRNATAQTFKWDTSEDIADSSDERSPSSSRHVQLPKHRTRQSFSKEPSLFVRNKHHRRKFRRWTLEEENVLKQEVARYGKGHWKHILQKHSEVFENRTEVDLKDKWRNIERRDGIL